jgi:toxin ParE1/3/4
VRQLRFSRRAEGDIEEIGDFIAQDNPRRAVSFIRALRERCAELRAFPDANPRRPELGDGVRMAIFGRYLILYAAVEDALEIRRVLHGARELRDKFSPDG